MYRAGLVLAGLVGGMVAFGGPALAASPIVTAASVQADIVPGPSQDVDDGRSVSFGDQNNLGQDNDNLDLKLGLHDILRTLGIPLLGSVSG
ncbi:hypothetical protein [Nonomuraea sp. 10N515B]|uniref:hypothetical protein n=1 Tax=Nonomuraea sp. 10N515B TaxID=3457422 RepID=UPI003FCDB65E